MMVKYSLTRDDSADIAFATTCLLTSIIDFSEFKMWIYHVIENSDDIPSYFFNILDTDQKFDYTLKRHDVVGFTPEWEGSNIEERAMCGIGFMRNPDYISDAVSREDALKALEENPHIEKRFREAFPFIEW